MANTYKLGQLVRITATVATTSGAPIDPALLRILVEDPLGLVTVYTTTGTVANPSTGRFTLDLPVSSTGVWEYRVSSTGAVQVAGEDYWRVLTPRVST